MLLVALLTLHDDAPPIEERIQRRAGWQVPPGVTLVGEYWLESGMGDPQVIAVVEADSAAALLPIRVAWSDAFDIAIFPAVTGEEGLAAARHMAAGSTSQVMAPAPTDSGTQTVAG